MKTLYVYDEIVPPMARQVAEDLRAKPREAVEVRVNSYGGSAAESFAIYNALKNHGAPVTILVEGIAFSSATIIACAGRCVAYESALFGFHSPWSEVAGPAEKLRDAAQSLDKFSESAATIYAAKTGRPVDEMAALMTKGETWLSAQEAKDLGFVDEVVAGKTAALRLGPLNPPARFSMMNTPAASPTSAASPMPVHMSADAIVQACAAEPGLVAPLLSQPRTEAEVQARLADAREIRQMAKAVHLSAREVDAMVLGGVSPDVAGPQIQRMLAERDMALRIDNTVSTPTPFGGYGSREFKNAAIDALAIRMGARPKTVHPAAHDFQDTSLTGMAALCLSAAGHHTVGMSRPALVKMAMTTSDFPSLLAGTANKSLTNRFEAMAEDHRLLCDMGDLPDFKPASAVNVSMIPGLLLKQEAGEIKYGAITDGAETYKLGTYARGLVLSREAIINDDLQAFASLIQSAASAAARLERDLVFGVLTTNAAMSDGSALFHANHANLDTTSGAISIASLNAARVLMRKQKDTSGGYVMTVPRFIVCPVAVEASAEAIVSAITYRPSTETELTIPQWVKKLAIISDPRLDAVDADDWYLLSDPNAAPVIRLAHLNGQNTPTVEESNDFDRDVVKYKVRFDVAAAAIGWAGAVKVSV